MDSYAAVEIEVKSNMGDFDPRIGMEARMHKIKAYTAHTIIALDGIPLRGYV